MVDFTEGEAALDRLEEAWADCAAGFRPGARQIRQGGGHGFRVLSLLTVHELMEDWRKDYEAGDVSALYNVLRDCLKENLPLPYWAAEGLLKIMARVDQEPGLSLHSALGLDSRYPLSSQSKGWKSRRDWGAARELWGLVCQHPKYSPLKPNTAAVREVLKANPRLPFSPRSADAAFRMVDRIQSRAIKTIRRSR